MATLPIDSDILIRIDACPEPASAYPAEAWLDDGSHFERAKLLIDPAALLAAEHQFDAAAYGTQLFDALFSGPIRRAYDKATSRAEGTTAGCLRVRLWIDAAAAELHALPWERLYHLHRGQDVALAATTFTPFSRYTGLEVAEATPVAERPLRLLLAIANPLGLPAQLPVLQVDEEVENVYQALSKLRLGLVQLTILPGRTGLAAPVRSRLVQMGCLVVDGATSLENLARHLPGHHILHLVSHGSFKRQNAQGPGVATLHLENADGAWLPVTDEVIVDQLARLTPQPHLIFLAACESAKREAKGENAFVGLAPKLVAAGIPAVVAMQDLVPVPLARQLTADFYRRLLAHGRVDVALNEARGLLFERDNFNWAIPLLFMRLRAGRLFAVEPAAGNERPRLQAPPPPATFAGRSAEQERLRQFLAKPGDAAISAAIQGLGGLGKSTLARKLGRDLAPHFPGGVLWVEIGPLPEAPAGVGQTAAPPIQAATVVAGLALRLGVEIKDEPHLERQAALVQNALAAYGRLLVILDDLWDVDLGRWLPRLVLPPDAALLITSRDLALCRALTNYVERLGVLPEGDALAMLTNLLGDLGAHVETAKAIITLLEGLPLALELAARLCDNGAADLPWLARQLRNQPTLDILKLEGTESRDTSVEACLALSYQALDADEQGRFRALGVFAPAPFDLAALAAVWGDEEAETAERAARRLLRRGLLVRSEEPVGADAATPIYSQHSLLRAYALSLLRRGDEENDPAGSHATHYATLAANDWPAGERFWPQIEHSWGWVSTQVVATGLKHLYTVQRFLYRRGRWEPYRLWTAALLERLRSADEQPGEQGTLLGILGFIASDLGEKQQALDYYEQALPLKHQLGDKVNEAQLLNNIGGIYADLGDKQQALGYYEQALPLRRQVDDKAGEATTLNNIGGIYADLGDKQQALAYYEQALPLWRQVGDKAGEATTLNNIGLIYFAAGEVERTAEAFRQALHLFHRVGDVMAEALVLLNLAWVLHHHLGGTAEAIGLLERSVALLQRYQLPQDAGGQTLAQHQALLAEVRGG